MLHSEKDITGRLRDGTSKLDAKEKEALWSGISSGLPATKLGAGVRYSKWRWSFLAIAMGILFIYALTLPADELDTVEQATEFSAEVTSPSFGNADADSAAGESETNVKTSEETVRSGVFTQELIEEPTINVSVKTPQYTIALKNDLNNHTSETLENRKYTDDSNAADLPLSQSESQSFGNEAVTAVNYAVQFLPVRPVAGLSIEPLDIPLREVGREATELPGNEKFDAKPSKWSLSAYAGSHLFEEQFRGDNSEGLATRLNAAMSTAPGQEFGLSAAYHVGKGFALESGLSYVRTHTILDYSTEVDTLAEHPTLPGQTTRGIGKYTVAHNNHFAWVSVPLLLNYQCRLGRFTAHLSGGIRANYQLAASGKTLAPNGFSGPISLPEEIDRFHLSYRIQPGLGLPISKNGRWSMQAKAYVERLNFGTSSTSGLEQTAWLYGTTIGISYR